MGDFATEALGLGMGLVNGAIQDSRQLKQNAKLRKQNMVYDKQWARFQQGLQMENWEATGYVGQRDQMMRAGINPALMYGMGGGGAQTMGAAPQQSGSPDVGHSEMGMGMQNAMQLALLQAQKDNIKAQTDKTKAETRVAEGTLPVQSEQVKNLQSATELIKAQTGKTEQEQSNLQVDWNLKWLEQKEKNLQIDILDKTKEATIDHALYNSRQAFEALHAMKRENKINDTTMTDAIKRIQAEATGAVLYNGLLKEQTKLTYEQKLKTAQEFSNAVQSNMQDWDTLDYQKKESWIRTQLGYDQSDMNENQVREIIKGIDNIFIWSKAGGFMSPTRNPIGFKK